MNDLRVIYSRTTGNSPLQFITFSRSSSKQSATSLAILEWFSNARHLHMATEPTRIFTLPYTDKVLRNFSNSTVNATATRENLNALMTALILQSAIIIVVFGNALVLAALACYRSWTSADILLFSLSLADFLDSAVAVELITVVRYFLGQQMAKPMCDVFVALVYTFRMASSFTVTCIAVERSLLLKFPLRHHTLVTPSRIKKFVAGIWLFSIFSAFLPLIGAGNSGFKNGECFSQLYDLGKAYAIYIETYGAIMFLAVFASYFTIKVSGIKFIRRQTLMRGHGGAKSQSSVYSCRESVHSPGKTSGVRSVRKLAVMMGMVVIIYYISWLPFLVSYPGVDQVTPGVEQVTPERTLCTYPMTE